MSSKTEAVSFCMGWGSHVNRYSTQSKSVNRKSRLTEKFSLREQNLCVACCSTKMCVPPFLQEESRLEQPPGQVQEEPGGGGVFVHGPRVLSSQVVLLEVAGHHAFCKSTEDIKKTNLSVVFRYTLYAATVAL